MPPSLEAEAAPPPSRLHFPRGPFHYEEHFGAHEPACMGHALLAHIGIWPSCLFRRGPLARPIPPGLRAHEREKLQRERGNPKSMVVATALMIFFPTTVWLVYVRPVVGAHGSWASLVITLCLATISLGFLIAAWLVEPGIMHVTSRVLDRSDIDRTTGQPRETWYIEDRVTGKQHNLIEFRAKFCRETSNCIENYDHFCPWVGNAIGARNYRDFVGFVFSVNLLSGFVGSSCVRGLIDHLIEGKQGVLESGGSPVLGPVMCIVLMLYCAVVFFTTLGLLTYHLCLIAKNQTTNEDLKKVYQNVRNLHDHGCLRNFRRFLCKPRRRSVVATPRTEQELEAMALVPRLPGSLDRNSIL